jgi:hypothetical protein
VKPPTAAIDTLCLARDLHIYLRQVLGVSEGPRESCFTRTCLPALSSMQPAQWTRFSCCLITLSNTRSCSAGAALLQCRLHNSTRTLRTTPEAASSEAKRRGYDCPHTIRPSMGAVGVAPAKNPCPHLVDQSGSRCCQRNRLPVSRDYQDCCSLLLHVWLTCLPAVGSYRTRCAIAMVWASGVR